MSVSSSLVEIAAQRAVALNISRGCALRIVDARGKQVTDLAIFGRADVAESFSPGRTIDYNESLRLAVGDVLYSNRSGELARVTEDSVGVHDLLLAPCSEAMFARRAEMAHRSCHGNLAAALAPFGITSDMVTATINVFMDVRVTSQGAIEIHEPASSIGDHFAITALKDLVVGIAACSSERTNAGRCKPVFYEVLYPASAD